MDVTNSAYIHKDQLYKSELNGRIIDLLDVLAQALAKIGCALPKTSVRSIESLIAFDDVERRKVIQMLSSQISLLRPISEKIEGPEEFGLEQEKELVREILAFNNYQVSDQFWKTLENHHHIQVFNDQMVQIYRSFNFFKVCGYSLLDLTIFEWYVLWERPKMIVEMMNSYVREVFEGKFDVKEVLIPKHIVRENYNSGVTNHFVPRAALSRFHQIAPLRHPGRNQVVGFIVTSSAEIIAEGDEAQNLGFV